VSNDDFPDGHEFAFVDRAIVAPPLRHRLGADAAGQRDDRPGKTDRDADAAQGEVRVAAAVGAAYTLGKCANYRIIKRK
jgi:hypothetical protein